MTESKNGFVACKPTKRPEPVVVKPQYTKNVLDPEMSLHMDQRASAIQAFKGREKTRLIRFEVLHGTNEYPTGTSIWLKEADRDLPELDFEGEKIVMIPASEIVLSQKPRSLEEVKDLPKLDGDAAKIVTDFLGLLRKLLP